MTEKNKKIVIIVIICVMLICSFSLLYYFVFRTPKIKPGELLKGYTQNIVDKKYDVMYEFLSDDSKGSISKEDFIAKNKNIYEGIETSDMQINITNTSKESKNYVVVNYDTKMKTLAGEIYFPNKASFVKNHNNEYKLEWSTNLIFPNLNSDDKVRVNTIYGERGAIYDRNGEMLAGKGFASSIGLVPGKMENTKDKDIQEISKLLNISVESINEGLNADYVKTDTFVPLKLISKDEKELENSLLQFPGIIIYDKEIRYYPLGEKASHLTGYIQNINAEEFEKLKEKNYNSNSVIGKSGLESIFEDKLRGIDGYEIIILNKIDEKKETLAKTNEKNGEDIKLTIDSKLQGELYDNFKSDKSCSVVMNPKSGEVLALVSTPTFNSNDFILGMSTGKWDSLNNDMNKPLYNRFKAALCPGSSFKPITASIGLTTGKIKPDDNYGHSGLSWQKDESWGDYKVTTLQDYGNEVNLLNALVYSDNIYFAKAALNIGGDTLSEQLTKIGFNEELPFEFGMTPSSFSNTNGFDTEVQLADSGYGQGQILINPIHMASVYSSFLNNGNMLKPYLIYKENPSPEIWKNQAFTSESAEIVKNDLIQVIERGTGKAAKINGVTLAGKTGTAEIKESVEDITGTELGWFAVFNADENEQNPYLLISMVEDVKERGGSGYVIGKVKPIFENKK